MKQTTKHLILIASLLLASTLALSACGDGKNPPETTPDTSVDTVGATDTETTPATEAPAEVSVTLTVKDQKGNAIAGAVLSITDAEGEAAGSATTDAEGKATLTLTEGTYKLNYTELPAYHLAGTVSLTVEEDMAPVALEVTNNTPDGSEEHPIFLNSETASFSFDANTTLYFSLFAGDRRSIIIENAADLTVTLDGTTHLPDENGLIKIPVVSDKQQNHLSMSITSKTAQNVTVAVVAELGSSDNPIVIEELGTITATVPKDGIVYYSYTVTDGSLSTIDVHSNDTTNNISMTNRNTSETTNFTNGATTEFCLNVKKDDVIIIAVSVLGGDASLDSYTLEFVINGAKG